MFKLGFSLFIKEVILFGLTLGLGLYTVRYYYFYFGGFPGGEAVKFTWADLAVLLIVLGAVFFIARHKRVARFSFKIFLILVIFSGTQVVLGTFLPSPWNLALALIFVLIFSGGRNVLSHNLGIIFGIGGIGAVFGLSISVEVGLVLLVVLSLYDIVAVYVTKHMVSLARSMVESGSVFGFLIPFEFKGFLYGKDQAKAGVGENFMILGSGDISLPLIFISSLAKISLASAFVTAGFSLLGLFVTHILFINQRQRRAMAALPPIATLTIIGYLVSQLL
ncbi:MAG: hypothetical protein A2651_01595 [Candidatus Yanofskybacteria bacterium RIFCSPHIGHO2_01_FULL_42_12]|uniref:Uncharacterized protein n=1 Tax=Candidatus Yanofskybacteria bacterium RIFCSPLOWO2_01_FULL_42_49 TaxID=1802694 RepID=A0A1F8GA39_9BACT|nr:MAG: hypothetical protein A2651_01595 [Candidatus Yanofskybacteria bacterium RIFCSPHIGHO2_01_FULL_42_12]OGN22235.1 MAG: hypothetical protein A2918_02505 [Candidatus Yanofskybacteria bacterium RIFCSPLOWO2_01_FULL_42_49]